MKLISILLISVLLIQINNAIIFKGSINTHKDWVFVEKFCITELGGTIRVNIDWGNNKNNATNTETLLLYSDKPSDWDERVIEFMDDDSDYTCYDKKALAPYQISEKNLASGVVKTLPVNQRRDRFWYLAFSNCNDNEGINIPSFEIEIINSGDRFDRAISADQHTIPQTHIFFFLLFVILLGSCIVSIVVLHKKGLESRVFKVLSVILGIKILSLALFIANWNHIIEKGTNVSLLEYFGQLFNLVALSLFIMILLLLSQGWTVSIYYGSALSKTATAVLILAFTAGSFTIYTIYYRFAKSYLVYIYFWDRIPGYILLGFFIALLVYFISSCRRSYNKNNDEIKKRFFILIGIVFTCWFISLPILITVAHFMRDWYRFKVINNLSLVFDAIWYVALIVIFFPYNNNPYVQILNKDNNFDKSMKLKESPNLGGAGEN